jgi:hypothetical protein
MSRLSPILEHALCPESLFADEYEKFADERSRLLVQASWYLGADGVPGPLPMTPWLYDDERENIDGL